MDKEKNNSSSNQTKYMQIHQPKKQMMLNNFLGGISWALGATIGLAIIIAVLTLLAHYINVIPFIGNFLSQLLDYTLKTNSHFAK